MLAFASAVGVTYEMTDMLSHCLTDHEAFERFRIDLLRHIGVDERLLLPEARRRRGGAALVVAPTLRIEHVALASLLVPTPAVAPPSRARHFDRGGVFRTAAGALRAVEESAARQRRAR